MRGNRVGGAKTDINGQPEGSSVCADRSARLTSDGSCRYTDCESFDALTSACVYTDAIDISGAVGLP
jgi:hypothetical protein